MEQALSETLAGKREKGKSRADSKSFASEVTHINSVHISLTRENPKVKAAIVKRKV